MGKKIKVSSKTSDFIKLELIKFFYENKRLSLLENFLEKFSKNEKIFPSLIFYFEKLSTSLRKSGRFEKSRLIGKMVLKSFNKLSKKGVRIPHEGLDSVSRLLKKDIDSKIKVFEEIKLSFPEDKFNRVLKRKLKILDSITSLSLNLMKIGSSFGIVNGYHSLIKVYRTFSKEIGLFRPSGKSSEYVDSFKKNSMDKLRIPLVKKANDFVLEVKRENIIK